MTRGAGQMRSREGKARVKAEAREMEKREGEESSATGWLMKI